MKTVELHRGGGVSGEPSQPGGAALEQVYVGNHSRLFFGGNQKARCTPIWTALTVFSLLPTTTPTAGKDDMLITLGTGTEVVARATKGGINLKTQASTPADNDNALLKPANTDCAMQCVIRAASKIRFSTRVNLTALLTEVVSAGLDENVTTPIPDATAGDGAAICFDPGEEMGDSLTTAQHANWILTEKVDGTDTYIDSGVPVLAGIDYELEIQIGEDLKPKYYINGELVGTGASALTSGDTVSALVGLQVNGTPAGQIDMDIRYVAVERNIG